MNTSVNPLVSPGTRFVAALQNATYRPSPDMEKLWRALSPLLCAPLELTLTRSVVPSSRSRRKMSQLLFVSPETSLLESLAKATYWPSEEMQGNWLWPPTCCSEDERFTRLVSVGRAGTRLDSCAAAGEVSAVTRSVPASSDPVKVDMRAHAMADPF